MELPFFLLLLQMCNFKNLNIMYDIEFYKENGLVNAFITGEYLAGIKVSATNVNELIEKLKEILLELAEQELN